MSIKLWHSLTKNPVPDVGFRWYFWQSSPPYKLQGEFVFEEVSAESSCEVFSLGGRDVLWRGLLGDVPLKYRSYLSEVRVSVPLPPAA